MKKNYIGLAILLAVAYSSVAHAQVVRSADGDTVNVRNGPATSYSIVGTIKGDEGSTLIGQEGSWYQVRLSNGVEGYVADYVTILSPENEDGGPGVISDSPSTPVPRTATGIGVTLKAATGALRLGPESGYDVVVRVGRADVLTYLESAAGWVHLALPNGRKGWIHGAEIELWDGEVAWPSGAIYDLNEGRWQIELPPVRFLTENYPLRLNPAWTSGHSGVLAAQTTMQVLGISGVWMQVQVADGRKGWVPMDLTQRSSTPAASVERTVLHTPTLGVYQLEVTGRLTGARINTHVDGISVSVPNSRGRSGQLDVLDTGITRLAVDASGVHLTMGSLLNLTVIEQTATRILLQLAPTLTGVTHRVEAGNEIYHIAVNGDAEVSTAISGSTVTVSLAGARQIGSTPTEVRTQLRDGHLDLMFTSSRPFALRKVQGGFDAIFYSSGIAGKVIMIDPGHGGFDPGASYNGLQEATLNLDVSLRLRDLLAAQGATVIMTRSDGGQVIPAEAVVGLNPADLSRADLKYRTVLANQNQVDLFVSVHHNASFPGARGTETYFSSATMNSASSKVLATMVQAELLGALGLHDRRVQDNFFYVIRHTQSPAILAEIAFLSDPTDAAFIAIPANRQRAVQALANAIGQFFDLGKATVLELDLLRSRLEQNPTSLTDYETYFRTAELLGVHQRLDTFVNGKKIDFDLRPFTKADRTLAPIRPLTEAIGAVVQWDPLTQQVTITKGEKVISLKIGSTTAVVAGRNVTLDVPANLVDGRTVVPLRFVSETFGLEVTWMEKFASIVLTSGSVQPS